MWAFLNRERHAFVIDDAATGDANEGLASEVTAPEPTLTSDTTKHKCSVGNFSWPQSSQVAVRDGSATVMLDGTYEDYIFDSNGKEESSVGASFTSHGIAVRTQPVDFPLFENHLRTYFNARDQAIALTAGLSFEDAFPDLRRAAEGLESLTLHEFSAYIERLTEESGTDIELFGARLPVDVLREWGLPVLIVMQLYLWLHVRMFAAQRERKPLDSTFPWIGAYRDFWSRFVTVASIALAPIAAIVLSLDARGSGVSCATWCLLLVVVVLSIAFASMTARELLAISRDAATG
jgi:hypothetical protein